MNRRFALIATLMAACCRHCAALPAPENTVTLAEYRQRLAGLESRIQELGEHPEQAAEIEAALPESEAVLAGATEIIVSYRDLKGDLAQLTRADSAHRPMFLTSVQVYVHALAEEAAAYEKDVAGNQKARAKLEAILARPEFAAAQKQNILETFRARILAWISRALGRIHFPGGGAAGFEFLQVLVYVVVAAAIGMLLFWIILRLNRPEEYLPPREIIPFSPSARGWRAWLADAHRLAQQQDWRDAIHLAYWAGIAFLEEHGAWKPNRARTPREYLKLIGSRTPQHLPLAALTRKFETVWYGNQPAAEPDFHEALGELERLGCR